MFISIGFIASNILCFSPDMWILVVDNRIEFGGMEFEVEHTRRKEKEWV